MDTRFTQILESCLVDQASSLVAEVLLPVSQALKRKIRTKTILGKSFQIKGGKQCLR
jgi:hypothetical protein